MGKISVFNFVTLEGYFADINRSIAIVQQFANLKLLDEYQLAVIPKILGKGMPMFKNVNETKLKLIDAKHFKNGIVLLRYKSE